jgi:SAM-dependent methyltransferase
MDTSIINFVPVCIKQQTIESILEKEIGIREKKDNLSVLDLGCGAGKSYYYFLNVNSKIVWTGIDIIDSPEMLSGRDDNIQIKIYDGVNIPYPDNYFDIIYCKQVFEHVRYPEKLLKEVHRVLKPGGYFVGSTSHLEPYHSRSLFNFTPLGFINILQDALLIPVEIAASIDSITLILRRILGRPTFFNIFWRIESPLNFIIIVIGKILGLSSKKINIIKLLFCGQFTFSAKK